MELKDRSSNPSFLNFYSTAKEIDNQSSTPQIGNTADILKNFILLTDSNIDIETIFTEKSIVVEAN